jgi:hypothetical protein
MEGCAVQFVPVVPHNSIKKLPFVSDWLFSGPLLANQGLLLRLRRAGHAKQGMWEVTRPYAISHVHKGCECPITAGTLV